MLQVYCLLAACGFGQISEEWTPIEYERGVAAMAVAVDSQLTREASYTQGSLLARITREGIQDSDGEIQIVWKDDHFYSETIRHTFESYASENSKELVKTNAAPHIFHIRGPRESWMYSSTMNFCTGNGLDTRNAGISRDLDVRPLRSWSTFHSGRDNRLSRIIKGFSRPGPPPNTQFYQNPDGLIRLKTTRVELVVSPISNGDLLRYSTYRSADESLEKSAYVDFLDMEWTWERDEHGIPYCRKWVTKQYKDYNRTEVNSLRIVEILGYNSQPTKAEMKFTLDELNPKVGTKCYLHTAKGSKQWKYGNPKEDKDLLIQNDLDLLIERAKKKGVSAPIQKKE